MMSIPTSEQPMNNDESFLVGARSFNYVDITRGLKVDRRHDSGPAVRDPVPSSRWPVMESSGDGRLSAFDRSFGFFLIVLVIELFQICFLRSGSHVQRVIGPEQHTEFWTGWPELKSWSLVTCSAPPYWQLKCNPPTPLMVMKEEDQHLFQMPPILTHMGIHLSHQPPTILWVCPRRSVLLVSELLIIPRLRCL